ncbi:MAG: hypothetical protein JWN32_1584 [Solirubrobacterales bacterium]|jgi:K+-transporting ATPase KdpF subunit|nr:hypothetical protein [Solirubrobacterales bacterium]
MSFSSALGLALSIVVSAYLIYVLLRGERF